MPKTWHGIIHQKWSLTIINPMPVLINYLQKRELVVKWNNVISARKGLIGGGPQGCTSGVWEYQYQSNDNAD